MTQIIPDIILSIFPVVVAFGTTYFLIYCAKAIFASFKAQNKEEKE